MTPSGTPWHQPTRTTWTSHSPGGPDAASFSVDEETGQLHMKEGMTPVVGSTFTVNLTATDSAGFGAVIIVMIHVTEAAHHQYDLNQNGRIEIAEVVEAVTDYFNGLIERDAVIALVKQYFEGPQ